VIAVLYTGRPDASAAVALGLPVERIEGIDGRRLPLGDDGSIPIPDGLSYVWINRAASSSRLIADTAASRMRPTSAGVEARRAPSPIVLRFRLDDSRYPRRSPPRGRGDAPDRHPDILELIRRVVNPRLAAGGQGLDPGDLIIDMAPAAMGALAGGAKQPLLADHACSTTNGQQGIMPAFGCNCPLCQMLRNAVWDQVNPATPASSASVAEFDWSLVVNTSGVRSPLL